MKKSPLQELFLTISVNLKQFIFCLNVIPVGLLWESIVETDFLPSVVNARHPVSVVIQLK